MEETKLDGLTAGVTCSIGENNQAPPPTGKSSEQMVAIVR